MTNRDDSALWEHYYHVTAGREPRPLLAEALGHFEAQAAEPGLAVDLGCGDGTETLALLRRGWRVLAIDQQPEAIARVQQRAGAFGHTALQTRVAAFEGLTLPAADLIYAGFSLPFCAPAAFPALWQMITSALRPGGILAGQLFGEHDSWAADPAITTQTRAEVRALLEPFTTLVLREDEHDGQAVSGPKHWHLFHLIARKPGQPDQI